MLGREIEYERQGTGTFYGSETLLFDTLMINMPLSTGYSPRDVNPESEAYVSCALWVTRMCQCGVTGYMKCITLVWDAVNRIRGHMTTL